MTLRIITYYCALFLTKELIVKKLSIIVLLIGAQNSFTFTNEQNESIQKTMVDALPESEELATDLQEDSSPDEDVLISSDDTQEEDLPDETQETPQEPLTIKEWLEARLFGPVIGRLMEYEWFVDIAVRVKKLIYEETRSKADKFD